MSSATVDMILTKVFIPLLTALIIFVAGWVWNTANAVSLIKAEMDHQDRELERLEERQKSIANATDKLNSDMGSVEKRMYGMETDITYIKKGIDDIKKDIQELKR